MASIWSPPNCDRPPDCPTDCPSYRPPRVIECRITAEDPAADFRPAPGRIGQVRFPGGPGVRVDTHVFDGHLFPPFYDSLLAKIIVRSHDRDSAVDAMVAALRGTRVDGISTVVPVHLAVLGHPDFRRGGVTTQWLPAAWPRRCSPPTTTSMPCT